MRVRINTAIAVLVLAVSATPVLAHHIAGVEYDTRHHVALRGTVTEVDWRLPHVMLHVNVQKSDGTTADWTIQTLGTTMLIREGLNQGFLKAGDTVGMTVCLAKDGSQKAITRSIELPRGTTYVRVGGC